MRKFLLSFSVLLCSITTQAQTVADFEAPKLPKADTAYINYSNLGEDVGFASGLAYFPCVYDTSFGYEYWAYGFAYSNMTDSVTSGFMNQYAAKTAKGFAGSDQYVVASGMENIIKLTGAASGKPVNGFYITNSTYAYNSMRDGDAFAKKFKASDSDFFRLDVFAIRRDTMSKDSVSFYLADFRFTDTTRNYIVRDWQWLDLNKLGKADSLYLRLSSSDTGFGYINTPLYFCMDNFITNETSVSVKDVTAKADLKVYPNPANNVIFVESGVAATQSVTVSDLTGRIIAAYEMSNQKLEINTSAYTPATYILTFRNGTQVSTTRFIKQ
jgi:hypothetical protein